jgi:NitT/TauT family transport system permease protein
MYAVRSTVDLFPHQPEGFWPRVFCFPAPERGVREQFVHTTAAGRSRDSAVQPFELAPRPMPVDTTNGKARAGARRLGRSIIPLSSLALVLAAWQIAARPGHFATFILPPPGDVFASLRDLLGNGTLGGAAAVTLEEAGGGMLVAMLVAFPLGYLLARVPLLEQFFAPIIAASQAVPMLAISPLLVIWLDTGLQLKIVVCTVIVGFSLLINTITGIRGVPREYIEVAKVFGVPWWERIISVEVPIAAPVLLAGVKVGVSLALTGAIVGEFVAADQGLGFLLNYYRENLYTAELFATLIVLCAIGITLFTFVTLLERMVARWLGEV